jgi:DNA-binding transcriptional LysR family regulator
MDISWDDARLFLAVAEAGSVSRAARTLKLTQPTASRRLGQLEAALGEPVFVRSVSGVALTPLGESLLPHARRMAEAKGELDRAAARVESVVEGVVRLTAPPGVAFAFCAPFAASLRAEWPGIRLEVVSSTRYLDLTRREADLALRFDRPTHRDQTCLATVETDMVAFATAEIAQRVGARPRLADLDWIAWAPPFDDLPPTQQLARRIPGFRPVFASDDFLVQYRAAEAGVGALLLGRMRHRFERASPLVELSVRDLPPTRASLHLVCAKTALDVPRIRAVADALVRELAKVDTRPPKKTAAARRTKG